MAINQATFPSKIQVVLGSAFGNGNGLYGLKENDVLILTRATLAANFAVYTESGDTTPVGATAPDVPTNANRIYLLIGAVSYGYATLGLEEARFCDLYSTGSWNAGASCHAAAYGWTGFATSTRSWRDALVIAQNWSYNFLDIFSNPRDLVFYSYIRTFNPLIIKSMVPYEYIDALVDTCNFPSIRLGRHYEGRLPNDIIEGSTITHPGPDTTFIDNLPTGYIETATSTGATITNLLNDGLPSVVSHDGTTIETVPQFASSIEEKQPHGNGTATIVTSSFGGAASDVLVTRTSTGATVIGKQCAKVR